MNPQHHNKRNLPSVPTQRLFGGTCVQRTTPQQANPTAMTVSVAKSTASGISFLSTIRTIHPANPKIPLTATNVPQTANVIFSPRRDKRHTLAHRPKRMTPTTSNSAAEISDTSSVVNVVAPIASNTKQNITGARANYHQPSSGDLTTVDVSPRAISAYRGQRGTFPLADPKFNRGKLHSVVIVRARS
jgi:hypothetical protein